MSKVKKYSRQLIVLFLVLATALTAFIVAIPNADASENGNYTVRLKVDVSTWSDCLSTISATMTYKQNNGTGTQSTFTFGSDVLMGLVNSSNGVKYTTAQVVSGFPTALSVNSILKSEGGSSPATRTFVATFTVQALNANGTWVDLGTGTAHSNSAKDNDNNLTTNYNVPTSSYPAISSHKYYVDDNQVTSTTVKTSTTHKYAVDAYDQYGTKWLSSISSAVLNDASDVEIVAVDARTQNMTFNGTNGGTDYSRTLNVQWANSSYTASLPINVQVPHSLTIDTNGGTYSGSNPLTDKYTGESVTLATPTRGGYTFASWTKTAGNGSVSGSVFTFGNNNATVAANWSTVDYMITPTYGATTYPQVAYNIESTNITLPTLTKTGYTFAGWEVSAAGGNWNVGDKVTSNPSGKYGNITVSPIWTPNNYSVLFDSILDFGAWNTASANNGTISNVTDNGFTLTSNEAVGEATSSSAYFPITAGKTYYVDADITGDNWDVYLFFCDESNAWVDFSDSTNRFSSNGSGVASRTFTAPEGSVKAQLRVDANGASNAVTFEDIRVYEVGTAVSDVTVPDTSKTVAYDSTYGELPTPTKPHYDFGGWFRADGTQLTADETVLITDNLSVFSKWTPHNYSFIIDENGGNAVADGSYTIEAGSVPSGITRTGYTFSHWEVAADAGNWAAGTTYAPGDSAVGMYGDVTLKAVWTANEYTLLFDLNKADGAVTEPECEKSEMTVIYDSAVGTLPVPTLDGYDFAGWFATATGGSQTTADTVYKTADDTTVYAMWTPHTYSIITDANNGDEVADGTYTIEAGSIPAGGTKTGYTFSHWEVAADAGNWTAGTTYNVGDSTVGMYGDVTLKAIWTANDYTVSFNLNDTAGVGSASADKTQITVTYDSALNVNETLPVATRNGYKFEGWYTLAEGGEQITDATVYTTVGASEYYAHWSTIEYTLTFNVNGGAEIAPMTYTVEDSLTLPSAERNGYTFTSWFYSSVTTGSWVRNTSYNADALALGTGNWGNVQIKANYTVKSYDITWIINGKSEVTSHQFNTVPTHADPVVEDDPRYTYVFKGWDPAIEVVSGEATYTAQFDVIPKEYKITWVADGVEVHSQNVAYGADIPADVVSVPEKTGHTAEWDYAGITTMPAENITIEAVYTPINYSIKWEVEGSVIKTDSVAYGSIPSYTGETPVKAEDSMYTYTFKGWTPAVSAVTGDTTYVAEFTSIPKEFKITWVADGVTIAEHTIAYGTKITNIPAVPTKLGMVGSWAGVPETMPAEDITIYATYVDGCLVTWYLDGTATGAYYQLGFANGDQIAYNRADPTFPEDDEYTYTFEGWSETEGGALITGYPVAGETDLAYYAVYSKTPKEYTIEWVAEGSVVFSEVLAFGSDVENVPEVPAKAGHTGKWVSAPNTMPAKNTTVTAEYTPIDYTITWVIGDNTYETTFAYGTMPSCSESTDKASTATTDFTFIGWDKNISAVTGDETYTAQYSESARKYTVTWQYEDGTVIDTDSVANGDAVTYIPVIAEKEGHTAVYSVPDVMPTENVTIIVTYEAKNYTITWVTPDGSVEESWKYGTTPVYSGEEPSKAATPEKEYTFAGWSPEVLVVTGDATYTAQFTETNRKYSVIWYVDGEFYDARDIAFGDIIPTLEVPAKTGFTAVWDNPFRTMPAQDVTINAVYTAKKYTVYWKVDGLTVYSASVSFGDVIPSYSVPAKVGCTGKWLNVPATMPAENITISAEYTANDYNVTWRVDGVEYADTATYGVEYKLTLQGETPPEEVRVTVGGNQIGTDSYTYDATTGELTIVGTAIIGDVYITARAAGGNFNVILNVSNATLSNDSLVVGEGKVYHTQIIPNAGYLLPESIEIFVDGMPITSGYTYDASNGKLTINAEVITGELEIAFDCPLDPDYDPSADTDADKPSSDDCDCSCHSDSAFTRFFFNIITFLRRIFGMTEYRYCECGTAHW